MARTKSPVFIDLTLESSEDEAQQPKVKTKQHDTRSSDPNKDQSSPLALRGRSEIAQSSTPVADGDNSTSPKSTKSDDVEEAPQEPMDQSVIFVETRITNQAAKVSGAVSEPPQKRPRSNLQAGVHFSDESDSDAIVTATQKRKYRPVTRSYRKSLRNVSASPNAELDGTPSNVENELYDLATRESSESTNRKRTRSSHTSTTKTDEDEDSTLDLVAHDVPQPGHDVITTPIPVWTYPDVSKIFIRHIKMFNAENKVHVQTLIRKAHKKCQNLDHETRINDRSPFINMKAIETIIIPKQAQTQGKLLYQEAFINGKGRRPKTIYMNCPATDCKVKGMIVPRYSFFVPLRNNILAPNDRNLNYMPYFSDSIGGEKTELCAELEQRFEDRMDDLQERHRLLEKEFKYRACVRRSCEELNISTMDLARFLLKNETTGTGEQGSQPTRGSTKPKIEEWRQTDTKIGLQKWTTLIEKLRPLESERLIDLTNLVCKVFFTLTRVNIWDVIKHDVDVIEALKASLQKKVKVQKQKPGDFQCLLCFQDNCQRHGTMVEPKKDPLLYSEVDDDSSYESCGSDMSSQNIRKYAVRSRTRYDPKPPFEDPSRAGVRFRKSLAKYGKNGKNFGQSLILKCPAKKKSENLDLCDEKEAADKSDPASKNQNDEFKSGVAADSTESGSKSFYRPFTYWKSHCPNGHILEKRGAFVPCSHEGACNAENGCSCVAEKITCEKSCGCISSCDRRYSGCQCARLDLGPNKTPHAHHEGHRFVCFLNDKCDCFRLNRECDPDLCMNCGSSDVLDPVNRDGEILLHTRCANSFIQRNQPKHTWMGNSRIQGMGLYAGEDIKSDEFVGEYKGEVVSKNEADRRGAVYHYRGLEYLFTLNKSQEIDSTRSGNKMRFINHSTQDQNCYPKKMLCNTEHRIGFFALRDIKAGEELLFDYGYPKDVTQSFWNKGERSYTFISAHELALGENHTDKTTRKRRAVKHAGSQRPLLSGKASPKKRRELVVDRNGDYQAKSTVDAKQLARVLSLRSGGARIHRSESAPTPKLSSTLKKRKRTESLSVQISTANGERNSVAASGRSRLSREDERSLTGRGFAMNSDVPHIIPEIEPRVSRLRSRRNYSLRSFDAHSESEPVSSRAETINDEEEENEEKENEVETSAGEEQEEYEESEEESAESEGELEYEYELETAS